ncbi:MAG: universal stress protein [Micromonosporaceae bacterium]
MLVVGSCGHGAFTGMLLGSAGQQCVQHACCPVVVVRRWVTAAVRPPESGTYGGRGGQAGAW